MRNIFFFVFSCTTIKFYVKRARQGPQINLFTEITVENFDSVISTCFAGFSHSKTSNLFCCECSKHSLRSTLIECPLTDIVFVMKCGNPSTDWSAPSIIIEHTSCGLKDAMSLFFCTHSAHLQPSPYGHFYVCSTKLYFVEIYHLALIQHELFVNCTLRKLLTLSYFNMKTVLISGY